MKKFRNKSLWRIIKGQGGFTLIEMIVVVGIIAVLAAVIVPNIGKFIGTGEDGAQDAEQGGVETAMAAMMAENAATVLAVQTTSTNSFVALPTGVNVLPLWDASASIRYIQDQTTNWFYCWDAQGRITNSVEDASRDSALAC